MAATDVHIRRATFADIPVLEALIAASARGLSGEDYSPQQIEGALRGAVTPERTPSTGPWTVESASVSCP